MIPSLGRSYHTDRQGRVDIAGLGAGPLAVIIRSPGYQPLFTRTVIPQNDSMPAFALDRLPQSLQTVTVIGARDFRGFEERRAVQAGGTYISRDDLAARESSRLSDVLRSVPGVRIQRRADGSSVLVSPRGNLSRSVRDCFYQIILDGQRIFALGSGGPSGPAVPPSIDDFAPNGLEGIEVYTGPATTPTQFGGLGAACGTIILWTRRH
jgi:outer membrane receptor for ferrienterochelin and colicin